MKKQRLEDIFTLASSILLIGALGFVQTQTFQKEIGITYNTKFSYYSSLSQIDNSFRPKKVETFIPYQR